MKIRLVEAEVCHADGQAYRHDVANSRCSAVLGMHLMAVYRQVPVDDSSQRAQSTSGSN